MTATGKLSSTARSRAVQVTAFTVAAGLVMAAIVTAAGATAGAATPRAQSVGRFLDGSVGGNPLQSLADLKDARATAAPDSSSRNPLDATLLGQADIPIGNGLQLPGGGVFSAGAANQIAVANTDEYSYGASGAVSNTGGAELSDDPGAYPADATINLSGAALGSTTIPGLPALPGLPAGTGLSAATLGGVVGKVGAVQALAQTASGGAIQTPQSSLADLQLAIGSPALAALLTQLDTVFKTSVISGLEGAANNAALTAALNALTSSSSSCSLTAPTSTTISLESGGVVINPSSGTVTVDLKILLQQLLGIDITHLSTSNFDLVSFLVQKLPTILSTGLEKVVAGVTDSLQSQFAACETALETALSATPLGTALPSGTLSAAFGTFESDLTSAISTLTTPLVGSSSSGLATLASGLIGVVDIGLNVQSGPKVQPRDTSYPYTTRLAATPDQATSVIDGQSLVRAVEIDLLDASTASGGLPSGGLPTTLVRSSRQLAGARAATGSGTAVSLALANAAAGPSTDAAAAPTSTSPTASVAPESTVLPTAVPAGAAGHDGGSPLVPAGLLLLGLAVAGAGVLSLRVRGRFGR